jgi:hypothetical protein
MLRWQTRLTADSPDSGPQSLALLEAAVVQIEGTFGAATVELRGSNSGMDYIPWDARTHGDVVAVLPTLYLKAVAVNADPTTDVLVTLVGRR